MTLGTKFRFKRLILGYSQQYVAHMLNISENTYRDFESDRKIPKDERLAQIATILGMTVEQLKSFGEGGIIIVDEIKCETGGYVGSNGVVNNHKSITDVEAENEKLKEKNISLNQRVVDIEKINDLLEKRISQLEEIMLLKGGNN